MNETIGMILIGIGLLFDFLGCVGLVRLPDVYNRLQAATKCVTLGTGSILLGVVAYTGFDAIGLKALLCIFFIVLTSPTAAHAISKGAYKYQIPLWEKSVCDQYKGKE